MTWQESTSAFKLQCKAGSQHPVSNRVIHGHDDLGCLAACCVRYMLSAPKAALRYRKDQSDCRPAFNSIPFKQRHNTAVHSIISASALGCLFWSPRCKSRPAQWQQSHCFPQGSGRDQPPTCCSHHSRRASLLLLDKHISSHSLLSCSQVQGCTAQ